MPDTVIYVRLSQDREGAGLGVQRQTEDCHELARAQGWQVDDVIIDNDMSASGRKPRPGYLALLSRMQAGEIARVIAWHTDRLHRSPLELEAYVTASEENHIVTRTVKAGELDLSTPAGRMVARVHCAIARHETEHKAERQKRAELQRAQSGGARISGLRAYGYADDRATVIPAEAKIIRDASSRFLAGESLKSICVDLNQRQIATVTGKSWQPTVLREMLRRPRIAGLSAYRGQIMGEGSWLAIIDQRTWRAICTALEEPSRRQGSNARRYLLTGLAVCDDCSTPMTLHVGGANRPTNSRTAYACPACRLTRSTPAIDTFVTEAVIARLESLDLADDDTDTTDQRAALQGRLEDAAERFAVGDISGDQLTLVSRRLRAELAKLTKAENTARRLMLGGVLGDRARNGYETMSLEQRRAVIGELLEVRLARSPGRTFRPDTIRLVWR